MGRTTLKMPQLGESVTEGTVDRWLKQEGDMVRRDEPIVEVVTDKVNAEIPSPFEGRLVRIDVQPGQTVPIGAALAEIEHRVRRRRLHEGGEGVGTEALGGSRHGASAYHRRALSCTGRPR